MAFESRVPSAHCRHARLAKHGAADHPNPLAHKGSTRGALDISIG
jgi:hypothetical protein